MEFFILPFHIVYGIKLLSCYVQLKAHNCTVYYFHVSSKSMIQHVIDLESYMKSISFVFVEKLWLQSGVFIYLFIIFSPKQLNIIFYETTVNKFLKNKNWFTSSRCCHCSAWTDDVRREVSIRVTRQSIIIYIIIKVFFLLN